jgi:hypothetical protein
VAVAILVALPISAMLGWKRAIEAARGRDESMNVAAGVVALTDVSIAVGFGLLQGTYVALDQSPGDFVGAVLYGLLFGFLALAFGTLAFLLPGLAVAIPSAKLWQTVMGRTFSQRGPAGGARGSGDRSRS